MNYKDKDELEEAYWGEEKSLSDIADECDVVLATIFRWMEKHNIPRRDCGEAAKKKRRVSYANYYTDNLGYPCSSSWIGQEQENSIVRVHQLLAIAEGADPFEIFDGRGGTVVHHKNECEFDNRPENIEVMNASDHIGQHLMEYRYIAD